MAQKLEFFGQVIKMSCRVSASNAFNTGKNHMEFIKKLGGLDIKMNWLGGLWLNICYTGTSGVVISRKLCGINTFFEHDGRM